MKAHPVETQLRLDHQTAITGWVATFARESDFADGRSRLRLLYGTDEALPKLSTDGSCAAIFDGVLFDRELLRKNLGDRVDPTWNEARLVIEAYRRWGEEMLHKIRGIFALILWDDTRNVLMCARDPLGIHPVYYAETGRELLVSSSLVALRQAPNVPRGLNRAALADQLCHRFPVPDETYFAGIRRIMAGNVLRENGSGCHVYRYWNPLPADGPVEWIREDALEQFDQLLDQAVARCLSVGPAGIYLSGGLDSVSVAAVAVAVAHRDNHPVPLALSLAFPHPDCSEEEVQRNVAAGLGMPQLMIPFHEAAGPEGLLWAAVEMSKTLSTPTLNPWKAAYFHLGRAAFQRGCRVIITGNGGDECLTVNPRYGADLIRSFNLRGFYRFGTNLLRSYHLPRLHHIRFILWTAGIRSLLQLYGAKTLRSVAVDRLRARRHARFASSTHPWVAPDEALRKELDHRIEQTVDRLMKMPDPAGPYGFYLEEMLKLLQSPLISLGFEEDFEVGRRLGLRIIPPYYDQDLLEVVYRMSPEVLQRGGREKGVVRETVARRFPGLKFERQKKVVATTFFEQILLTEGPRAWQRMGGMGALGNLGIVDARGMQAVVEKGLAANSYPEVHRIWELLTLEGWVRAHS